MPPSTATTQRATGAGEMERVLIYGSRGWIDSNAVRDVILKLSRDAGDVVIHGGATGADALADKWARACGLKVEIYKADWKKHGRAAGPIRNRQMIVEGKPTRGYGFRSNGVSRGTDDMTTQLLKAGIPTSVQLPAEAWGERPPARLL